MESHRDSSIAGKFGRMYDEEFLIILIVSTRRITLFMDEEDFEGISGAPIPTQSIKLQREFDQMPLGVPQLCVRPSAQSHYNV